MSRAGNKIFWIANWTVGSSRSNKLKSTSSQSRLQASLLDRKQAPKGKIVTLMISPDEGCELKALSILDRSNKEIEVEKIGEVKYAFEMPQSAVTVEAAFAMATEEAERFPVADVEADKWYGNGLSGSQ